MAFFEELNIFIKSILHWLYFFVGSSVFFFVFGLKKVVVFGKGLYLPIPNENSFSVQFFNKIRHDTLPSNVQLITTSPMSAFISQVLLAVFLGFLFTIPLLIYKIIAYLSPALLPREKRVVMWSLIPFVLLFCLGSMFSYFFLVPATFKIFYPFATIMGATSFFFINEFIMYVFDLMVAAGIMFLLPLFMILLSFLNIIKAKFWISKWRYAFLFFLILCAVITPDGTGITMVMLFIPLMVLYFAGYFFANRFSDDIIEERSGEENLTQ